MNRASLTYAIAFFSALAACDEFFQQPVSVSILAYEAPSGGLPTKWTLAPQLTGATSVQSFGTGQYAVLTASALYVGSKGENSVFKLDVQVTSSTQFAGRSGSHFLLLSDSWLVECDSSSCASPVAVTGINSRVAGAAFCQGVYWVATARGLLKSGSTGGALHFTREHLEFEGPLVCLACQGDSLAVSQQTTGFGVLYQLQPSTGWQWAFTPGLVDSTPQDLSYGDDSTLWIADSVLHSSAAHSVAIERYGALQGLPRPNLTSVSSSGSLTWLGSQYGVAVLNSEDGKFDYLATGRFLPATLLPNQPDVWRGARVIAVSALDSWSAVVLTDEGVSVIEYRRWTLEEKAAYLQGTASRYSRACGNNTGAYTHAQARLSSFGGLSSAHEVSTDNDGLYTSIYVISQCYRYAETKDAEAKQQGWAGVLALKYLHDVTGIGPGLIARSVNYKGQPSGGGTWHQSSIYPDWWWKGNVSSDEVTGHQAALTLAHKYLAETQEEKQLCVSLLSSITHWISENGFRMKGYGGVYTRWGDWSPESLNYNGLVWEDDRGHNSMQILAWLLTSYKLTGSKYFEEKYRQLALSNSYLENIVNTRITNPSDAVWFDIRLSLFPILQITEASVDLGSDKKYFEAGLARLWRYIEKVRGPWGNIVARFKGAPLTPKQRADLLFALRTWPVDGVLWPTVNTGRWDTTSDPEMPDWIREPLPYYQLSRGNWGDPPFDLKIENTEFNNGMFSPTPSGWLWAYWLAKVNKVDL